MVKKKKDSQQQTGTRPPDSPHPALKLRHTLRGHTSLVLGIALSPDGFSLASSSANPDNTVRLWDVRNGRVLKTLKHKAPVRAVCWSPDGTTVATGTSDDKRVYLWDSATGRQIRILEGHSGTVKEVAWSPKGKILASCSSDGTIRLWDPASGQTLHELRGHLKDVDGVAWSPEGSRLCSGSWDNVVKLWVRSQGKKSERWRDMIISFIVSHGFPMVITLHRVPSTKPFASGMPKLHSSNMCSRVIRKG